MRNPGYLVPGIQSVHDLRFHALGHRVVDVAGQARKRASTVTKMSIGCVSVTLANLILAGAAWQAAGDEASWLWLLAYS